MVQRLLKGDCAVNIIAYDFAVARRIFARTFKCLRINIRNVFNCADSSHYLEYRAGSIQTRNKAVEINSLVFIGIIVNIVGLILRIIRRGGNHADHRSGFVIIYGDRALSAVHRFVSRFANIGVKR